ncbi:hypothetical protein BJF90_27175 [Pseudonocardia sp. CNS-004]|nr:hypothetical protein BJF90_27175 [Pseudonocardia sp. CNS-004]
MHRSAISSAAAVLALVRLIARRGSVTVTEVSRELDVAVSTAHRLLATCVREGFARQDHVGGPYTAGPTLHELTLVAGSHAVPLRDAGAEVLAGLREELGETISLAILEGRHTRFVQSLEGPRSVRVSSRLGLLLPAHSTSGGKAMLAALAPSALRERYPSQHLEATTDRSIADWDAWRASWPGSAAVGGRRTSARPTPPSRRWRPPCCWAPASRWRPSASPRRCRASAPPPGSARWRPR